MTNTPKYDTDDIMKQRTWLTSHISIWHWLELYSSSSVVIPPQAGGSQAHQILHATVATNNNNKNITYT